ncbi:DUF418 domain-containing protein [Phenylobacterium sp.]|uniref:DUF418 domain-containing protein n=1 Tax=Phenylobacterium sp. TaxID=1871053 RepID=UPI0039833FC0
MPIAMGAERHVSIDAVRGFAVLGIALMNIVGMGLPSFAYIDPTYAGGSQGWDLWTWAVNNVLTDGKMRALFTMLFGASAVLIAERAEGGRPGPAQTHYRRMFWLLVFGMLHAYLFWFGDILVCYALAGLVIFPFRKLGVRAQIGIGVAVLALLLAKNQALAAVLDSMHAAATAPGASTQSMETWRQASVAITPPPGAKAAELAGFGGTFLQALEARAKMVLLFHTVMLPLDGLPEAIGQMFIGMGLFRSGFFTLGWSTRAYARMIAFGYLVCAPVTAWLAWLIWKAGFEALVLHRLEIWQAPPKPFIALAHASVLLLVIRAGLFKPLVNRLEAAGRMAFSNYLMTSMLTSLVFGGYGLGFYGELSRAELLIVVAALWAFMLVWSLPWLARFQYGPFEWAWRSLVKWRPQPFVRAPGSAAPAAAE